MEKTILIKNIEALVDLDSELGYLKNGYLLVEDGIIQAVGSGALPHLLPKSLATVIDAKGMIAVPGFINTHHHFFQTLTRAYPPTMDAPLFDWLKRLYPIWAKLDEEAIYLSTQAGMVELMLSGCTTTTDHHYIFSQEMKNCIDIQLEAARELGMRFQPCRGSMSLSEKDGGLPPDFIVQSEEEILKDSERLIKKYHDSSFGAMIRISLAPCSPFSVTAELMRETAKLARKYNVRLHTHLAETLDEERFCQERYSCRPLDYLEEVGWLADDVWLAHGIHFPPDEISRLSEAKVAIAHCPSSNMRLGSGIAPVLELLKNGVPVGLAVDGSASNDSSNMLLEIRQALFLQRLVHGPAAFKVKDVLRMATNGGARCLGQEAIGALKPGKAADIALFDLEELNYSGAGDPLGALVLCAPTTVHTLIVNGKILVKDHQLQNIDVESLIAKHQKKARKLMGLL